MLAPLDIAVIVAWLAVSLTAGLLVARRASGSAEDFFAAGRSLPWWVVGTSMVATTFAADTPLAVSGWVAGDGIAANWIWWTFGLTGTAAVFLFAPLWRRSGVLTDAELVELRYGPGAGRWLRRFKAGWFGLFWNGLVVAWVVKGMVKVATVVLGLPPEATLDALVPGLGPFGALPATAVIVAGLFALTVGYTVASGLWGVVVTDLLQFVVAIAASFTLGVLAWFAVGGLEGLQEGFAAADLDWDTTTALLPADGAPDGATAALVVFLGLLWWSGTNVDGGGYLAQRLFAAKDERHATLAYLWFTVAHLVLRPWPWIIVGLAGMVIIGVPDDAETIYPQMMTQLLPAGALGLMVASFLAAFMSTIDTQLNWGASLVVHDLWRPLAERLDVPVHEVTASRLAVVLLGLIGAVASFLLTDIGTAWKLAISVTAGLGSVYVARWLWWRTSAWSEIAAMVTAAAMTLVFSLLQPRHPETVQAAMEAAAVAGNVYDGPAALPLLAALPAGWLAFPFSAGATVLISVPIWLTVTLLTPPPPREALEHFARVVRPGGPGWPVDLRGPGGPSLRVFGGIVAGSAAIYGALLGTGWLLLGHPVWGLVALGIAIVGAIGCALAVRLEGQAAQTRNSESP